MDAAASTPTRSFTNTSASSSTRLFDAVVRKKYEELIQLYGQVAVTALQSYQHQLELQQQQQKQQQQLQWPPDNSHSGREEKTDEFYTAHLTHHNHYYGYPHVARSSSSDENSPHRIFQRGGGGGGINRRNGGGIYTPSKNRSDGGGGASGGCADLLRDYSNFLKNKNTHPSNTAPPPRLCFTSATSSSSHQSFDSSSPASSSSLAVVNCGGEADQWVRDAVRALCDTRPPSNFVVYSGGIIAPVPYNNNEDNDNVISNNIITNNGINNFTNHNIDNNMTDAAIDLDSVAHLQPSLPPLGPPIFDGSVANATPAVANGLPLVGGAAAGPTTGGGGIGTALHAATALDHPLTVAFLLAMGADTRACHTTFRRLVQHEAACNGSVQCLTLLLELGNQYGNEQLSARSKTSPFNESSPPSAATRSPDTIMEFPFFSRRATASTATTTFHPTNVYTTTNNTNSHTTTKALAITLKNAGVATESSHKADILSLLRLFRVLIRQVATGSISELDAARTLMRQATVSHYNKVALASQCGFPPPPAAAARSNNPTTTPFLRRSASVSGVGNSNINSSADGHGNTPLHWAAFKNETACVSLLLKYRADPNARAQPSGWTPLHDAAYSNGREAIGLLIDAGARVDARAHSGATPLCFAAQEDAAEATELLLIRGANLSTRCCAGTTITTNATTTTAAAAAAGNNNNENRTNANNAAVVAAPTTPQSRFSGYTPLHYCAHYNAHKAAKVLLQHSTAAAAMEIYDLNERLPIHVAVARGSSDVLRELLRAGARVETRRFFPNRRHHSADSITTTATTSPFLQQHSLHHRSTTRFARSDPVTPRRQPFAARPPMSPPGPLFQVPMTPPRQRRGRSSSTASSSSTTMIAAAAAVSSPLLRSMIPSQPILSSKPWNCLSQRSIDECRQLISEVEQNWTPDRHSLFTPVDRRAVAELLRVGKRLEWEGSVTFLDMWPEVLSFCGRGWFEVDDEEEENITETEVNRLEDDLSLPTFC